MTTPVETLSTPIQRVIDAYHTGHITRREATQRIHELARIYAADEEKSTDA